MLKMPRKKFFLRCPPHKNSVYITNSLVPRSEILRAMFAPLPFFFFFGGGGGGGGGGPFEIFEGHILPSVKHNPIRFFYKS